ncbi:hypothetical protein OG874_36135 [Nocardia sp. NBC_00565]|uniref:hypothetical protein n=1 Tax=Nocardia sp. NBC_00565 TaxID=2975993 RepID=UPI002E8009BC|nr:hypothetical protein [Nocardia sp. NBC_00565]WUC02116.1 hypothetical protein OG874_36135 [Nocardia sp. NBC_00565]
MNEIEYVFGTGDGTVHVWTSQADLDLSGSGAGDAVRLDFDGDGLVDDVLWDSHGTGIADVVGLDLDDDGTLDHFFTDPTGNGTWNHQITGNPADANSEHLDWIVRAEPEPDHLIDHDSGASVPNHDAPPPDSPWSDPQVPSNSIAQRFDEGWSGDGWAQVATLQDHRTWSGDEPGATATPFTE